MNAIFALLHSILHRIGESMRDANKGRARVSKLQSHLMVSILVPVASLPPPRPTIYSGFSRRITGPFIDIDPVTRVELVGKTLPSLCPGVAANPKKIEKRRGVPAHFVAN